MTKPTPFVKHKQTIVFAVNTYLAVVKFCKKTGKSFNRFVREAIREKCDRDGIEYEEYEE